MKSIRIIYENSNATLCIRDKDDTDLDTYTKKLLKIFEVNKMIILKTSEGNYIIKPSKILSIDVSEMPEVAQEIDMITDVN